MSRRGWRPLDHTADLALEVHAATEEDLLEEAGCALVAVMTASAAPAPPETWGERRVTLDSLDPADRLVRWLNEVIYLAVSEGFLVRRAAITLRADGLDARARGETDAGERLATELKSATYHDLYLAREEGGWRARFVVDV